MNKKEVTLVADSITDYEKVGDPVEVALTNELVHLLSDQLYQTPIKAIEELVVNSYDADASQCRIYVPNTDDQTPEFVIVFDDGIGMDKEGLTNLWQIGRSNKRDKEIQSKRDRKQIGKFGIGKLATYTIANRLTYITKTNNKILSVAIDFKQFLSSATGENKPVKTPVYLITDLNRFISTTHFNKMLEQAQIDSKLLLDNSIPQWTIAILEDLKPKVKKLTRGRLEWILSTAMPLKSGFNVYLNGTRIASSKEHYKEIVHFDLCELSNVRLQSISFKTGEEWTIKDEKLVSDTFISGISGTVIVTEKPLLGKSDDLFRSHGFFIYVRERLVNEDDSLFGIKALFHGTFNRFRADIYADDLDLGLKASREAIEESKIKQSFRVLLRELFNEANSKREESEKEKSKKKPIESERDVVSATLVEYPIADALIIQRNENLGAEADEGWFYLNAEDDERIDEIVNNLYNAPRDKYKYNYTQAGNTSRLVKFDPAKSEFWLNVDHELVIAYMGDPQAKLLLEDIVTAETLLEIYLRESLIDPHISGAILEQRDKLLRSLAKDHSYSLGAISTELRDSAEDDNELEIALVVAARALGFVATHISGSKEPDGLARFNDYPGGERKIILEAKSSKSIPSLSAIDFAGLRRHMVDPKYNASGCLLIAPAYPASTDESSAVAQSANQQKISCWTIDQLARVIEVAESRQITARHVLDIVLKDFAPLDVAKAVDNLLREPSWEVRTLYNEVLKALKELDGRLMDTPRTIAMVAALITNNPDFAVIEYKDVEKAVKELASASQGGMNVNQNNIIIHLSHEELLRRVAGLTQNGGNSRKHSGFRKE